VLVTAALTSEAGVSGLVPERWCRGSFRSVRGMNELGKAHPAGEARWVRVWHSGSGAGCPPSSALAEASEANDLSTCAGSVQRELRGPVFQESTLGR
jgi:hypothetical protein